MRHLHLLIAFPLLAALAALSAACGGGGEEAPPTTAGRGTVTPAAQTAAPAAAQTYTPAKPSCPEASGAVPEVKMKRYDQAPPMTIDPQKKYTATVKTVRGDFTIVLRPDLAPQHVNSFVFLARDGFFDGVTFHRVEPGFVIQGGDPTGTGTGGPGYKLPAEFTQKETFVRGVVGMARTADPNSAGSQFFVTLGDAHHLDGQYTIFGTVSSGMDVVDCIQRGDAIIAIEISEQ